MYRNLNKFEKALAFIREQIDKTSEFYGKIYLVGGCVRDELLGLRMKDIDLLIDMPDGQKRFVEYMCATYPTICKGPFYYKRYGTTAMDMIIDNTLTLVECVEPHIEIYNEDGTELIETRFCSLQEDAIRRDFACNALYKNLHTNEVLDPTGMGLDDVKNRYLRTPGDPDTIFRQDPVRMLRGIRFKHQKRFKLDSKAWMAIAKNSELLVKSAKTRIKDEVYKMFACTDFAEVISDLEETGLIDHIFPSIREYINDKNPYPHLNQNLTIWQHTLKALRVLMIRHPGTDLVTKLVVLLADIAMIDRIENVNHIIKYSVIGEIRAKQVRNLMDRYLMFHELFMNGIYINRRSSVLPRFIHSLATNRDCFRQLVRALNTGMTEEYQLPYQILYDKAPLPKPHQRAMTLDEMRAETTIFQDYQTRTCKKKKGSTVETKASKCRQSRKQKRESIAAQIENDAKVTNNVLAVQGDGEVRLDEWHESQDMGHTISRIVLTGGPCAGKTTALAFIKKYFTEQGYAVLYVPEVPTMITGLGWNYMTDNHNFYYEGEKIILEMQLELEDKVQRLAETLTQPVIIVCDRGSMDISAYISHEMWEELMASCGTNQEEILQRYDGVIHLASAAHGAEQFYTVATNENRYEQADEAGLALARELDQKVYDAWSVHPVMHSIPSLEDFDVKMKMVIGAIESIVHQVH